MSDSIQIITSHSNPYNLSPSSRAHREPSQEVEREQGWGWRLASLLKEFTKAPSKGKPEGSLTSQSGDVSQSQEQGREVRPDNAT